MENIDKKVTAVDQKLKNIEWMVHKDKTESTSEPSSCKRVATVKAVMYSEV